MECYVSGTNVQWVEGVVQNLGTLSCLRMEVREGDRGRVKEWILTLGENWEDVEIISLSSIKLGSGL